MLTRVWLFPSGSRLRRESNGRELRGKLVVVGQKGRKAGTVIMARTRVTLLGRCGKYSWVTISLMMTVFLVCAYGLKRPEHGRCAAPSLVNFDLL